MSNSRIILPNSVNLSGKIHAPTERPFEKPEYVSAFQNKELREQFATEEGFALMAHGIDLVEQAKHAGMPDAVIQRITPIARLICHAAPSIDQEILAAEVEPLEFTLEKDDESEEEGGAYQIVIGGEEDNNMSVFLKADTDAEALATFALILRRTAHAVGMYAAQLLNAPTSPEGADGEEKPTEG